MVDLADLERRVFALETANSENTKTLNWVVGTLGRVAGDVAALRDDMRKGFEKVETDMAALREDIGAMDRRLAGEMTSLRKDMPGIVADAMREVLGAKKD